MKMVSSWSWPIDDCPLLAITPITLNGWLRMRMICPVGSTSGPNSVSRHDGSEHGDLCGAVDVLLA